MVDVKLAAIVAVGSVAIVAGVAYVASGFMHPKPPHPGEGVIKAVIHKEDCQIPQYPDESRTAGEEGSTLLSMLVDKTGKVVDSKVVESSGHDRLDQAARSALSQCTFKPETMDGTPRQSWNELRFTWRLSDAPPAQ